MEDLPVKASRFQQGATSYIVYDIIDENGLSINGSPKSCDLIPLQIIIIIHKPQQFSKPT